MCGIAGVIDFRQGALERVSPVVKKMTDSLSRRGPDDRGRVGFAGESRIEISADGSEKKSSRFAAHAGVTLALGHTRLSIQDLSSRGHQPMATADGRFWIVFNGEIYNFRGLRAELEAAGSRFQSDSDTEVLLRLYEKEGPDCVRKLRGMFAFAVWDEKNASLFMARDRFGMKPLYYTQPKGGSFAFASEQRALLASGFVAPVFKLGMDSIFLQRGHIPGPDTCYENCFSLPPGRWMVFDRNGVTTQRYWSLERTLGQAPAKTLPAAEAAHVIREALADSVRAHQVSDVPVGLFLSGGLDSAALAACLKESSITAVKAFTLVFPGTKVDESCLSRDLAARYGLDAVQREITERDFYEGLDDFFDSVDQPSVDGLNTYFVARLGREAGLKVALSGLGGDEALGGYSSYVEVPQLRRLKHHLGRAGLSRAAAAIALALPWPWAGKLSEALRNPSDAMFKTWQMARCLWTPDQMQALGLLAQPAWLPGELEGTEEPKDFFQIMLFEMREFMSPQLLRDSDALTLRFGLELRTPFVDHLFLEKVVRTGGWSRGTSPSFKIELFKAMKGFLPQQHLNQPKRGFVLPFENWLKRALLAPAHPAALDIQKRLSGKRCEPWTRAFLNGRLHWSRIWALYVKNRFWGEAS